MTFRFLFVFLILFTFACENPSGTETKNPTEELPTEASKEGTLPFLVSLDSLIKRGGGPCTGDLDCMTVRVIWPRVEGGDKKIRKMLNDSIHNCILMNMQMDPEVTPHSFEEVADMLIQDYKIAYENEGPEASGWSVDVEGSMDIHHQIAVLTAFTYTYMGGAHPNYYTMYNNYDIRTGTPISFAQIVKDSTRLRNTLQKRFLKTTTELTGETTSMDDFFFGSGFAFPENFALRKDSIEFIYNPYEAAPYVFGDIRLKYGYQDLQGVIELGDLKK